MDHNTKMNSIVLLSYLARIRIAFVPSLIRLHLRNSVLRLAGRMSRISPTCAPGTSVRQLPNHCMQQTGPPAFSAVLEILIVALQLMRGH